MKNRYARRISEVRRRLVAGPAVTDHHVRELVAEGKLTGDQLVDQYVAKVRQHAYRLADNDIQGLLAAGLSEDEVFELTLCAAFGAAEGRLAAGLSAIERSSSLLGVGSEALEDKDRGRYEA